MRKVILLSLSLVLLSLNFIPTDINGVPEYNGKERYTATLGHIRSVSELEKYTDQCAALKNIETHSPQYAAMLAYVISCRFYHGFSHYSLKENWIAAMCEKLLGYGLASKVDPEEILQHPYAACSQQSMVMMAVLRNKGISYRKVGFPHHYAIEAQFNGHWFYFDPNMEPRMNLQQRTHENWVGSNDNLKQYYSHVRPQQLQYQLGKGQKAEIGPVNELPARNAHLFQTATGFMSKMAWIMPLVLLFVKRKRRPFMYAIRPVNRRLVYRIPSHYPYYS